MRAFESPSVRFDPAKPVLVGSALARPECVIATRRGSLYVSDIRGGVTAISPDGTCRICLGHSSDLQESLKPNGIALEADGSFLIAHLGDDSGGIFRLQRDGQLRPEFLEADGTVLPPSNFVTRDTAGTLWATISTRLRPRALDYSPDASTGFIVADDGRGPHIVADGLGFTNEALVDPAGTHLYVVETYARRLTRFPLLGPARLGTREVVAEFGPGQFPDGFAFDASGNVWIAGIISNQLIYVDVATGRHTIAFEDSDPEHTDRIETAFQARKLDRALLGGSGRTTLRNISSIAFGGPDLRTGYLGCLLGDAVVAVDMPVAGHPPVHWNYE